MSDSLRGSPRVLHRVAAWVCAALALSALLLIPGRARAQEGGIEVFGLTGVLRDAVGQPFTTYLVVDGDGRTFGLFGRTPQVDQMIGQFQAQGARVRVWGVLFEQGRLTNVPNIVVDSITSVTTPPAATPTPSAQSRPFVIVTGAQVNIRSGPGTEWPPIGVVTQGTICTATGRNGDLSWLRVECPSVAGWILASLTAINGNVQGLPVVSMGPPPVQEVLFPQWKASYFANRDLAGAPSVIVNVPELAINWGFGSPDPRIPVDRFSARFERTISFAPGNYRIQLTVDDGARVWVNNQFVLDDWRVGSVRTLQVEQVLNGATPIVVEYFEEDGQALIGLAIDPFTAPPVPTPSPGASELTPPNDQWAAAYWNNRELAGQPLVARFEQRSVNPLDRNWGSGSPVPGTIGVDNWSARWRGVFQFASGDHVFRAVADDGIRVRIDGHLLIDAWVDGHKEVSNTFQNLGAGLHTITVEFYERTGTAYATVLWSRTGGGGGGNSGIPGRDQ